LIEAPPSDLIRIDMPSEAIVPGHALEVKITALDLNTVKVDGIYESFTVAFNDPARTRVTIPIKVMK